MKKLAATIYFTAAILGSLAFAAYTLMLPLNVFAAAVQAQDDFESYPTGIFSGGSGGSGWSNSWTSSVSYITSTTVRSGTRAVYISNQAGNLNRSWTPTDSGEIVVWVRNTSGSDNAGFALKDNTSSPILLNVCYSGYFRYFDGTYHLAEPCAADTWYQVTFNWDYPNQGSKWRYKIGTSTYSAWYNTNGTFTTISGISLIGRLSGDTFFDDISSIYASPPATTTPTTTVSSTYDGANYHEWLFVACVVLFFISFVSWPRMFHGIKTA